MLNTSILVRLEAVMALRQTGAPGQDFIYLCIYFAGEAEHFESLKIM